jgi:hypothetical protein
MVAFAIGPLAAVGVLLIVGVILMAVLMKR